MTISNAPNIDHSKHRHEPTAAAREACRKVIWSDFAAQEQIEIRRTVGGQTISYHVLVRNVALGGPDLLLNARVTDVMYSYHLDGKLDRQRESIERLLDHLKHDCPELSNSLGHMFGKCEFAAKQREESA